MSKHKNAAFVIIIIILAIIVDDFRQATHIPVSLLDIVFFPFFVFIILYTLWSVLSARLLNNSRKKPRKTTSKNPFPCAPLSVPAKCGFLVTALGMLALGIWAMWEGIEEPGKYFTGVRGSLHGYSLVPMGLCIAGISIVLLVQIIFSKR